MPYQSIKYEEDVLVFNSDFWEGMIVLSNNANLIRLKHVPTGLDILRTPNSMKELRKTPEQYGMPILFPPGRIPDGKFIFNERCYSLPVYETELNNNLHGLILGKPWTLASVNEDNKQLSLAMQYKHDKNDETYSGFPHSFLLEIEYCFTEDNVKQTTNISNTGESEMPFGIGYHTAFNINPNDNLFITSDDERWEMSTTRKVPTKKKIPLNEYESFNLIDGKQIDSASVGMICDLKPQIVNGNEFTGAIIAYSEAPLKLAYEFGSENKFIAVWNDGGGKGFVCIEPWTSMSNALNMDMPFTQSGLKSLSSGETWESINSIKIQNTY